MGVKDLSVGSLCPRPHRHGGQALMHYSLSTLYIEQPLSQPSRCRRSPGAPHSTGKRVSVTVAVTSRLRHGRDVTDALPPAS